MVAWPQTVTVPNLGHQQLFTPASFMAYSATILNPNDGVCYVARDRDCLGQTVGAWDWKVPSQSYAALPGPFHSIGIYYLDRSGAGLPGEVTAYATDHKIDIPSFMAIGRAQISNVTTLDIGQGTAPGNPPANTARLWADVNGDLWVTLSTGQTYKLVDSNDALGGVLLGTLPNPSHSTGPHDFPSLIRTTGLGNYNSASGAGIELYYNNNAGVIQCYDRSASVARDLSFSTIANLILNPNGQAQVSRLNLQTAWTTNAYRADQLVANGQILVAGSEWLRLGVDGYGVYSNGANQGIVLSNASGVVDYASSRRFARMPVAQDMAAGDIVHVWGLAQAPSGSTSSGTATFMPGQFGDGSFALTGYAGGRLVILANLQISNANANSGGQISYYLDSVDQNYRTQYSTAVAGGALSVMIGPITYTGGIAAGSHTVRLAWALTGAGSISINTGVYSWLQVIEYIK